MIKQIESILNSMGHRKLLFIVGDHLCGKTELVKNYLQQSYGVNADKHYIDVGLYIQKQYLKKILKYINSFQRNLIQI